MYVLYALYKFTFYLLYLCTRS